MTKPRLTIIGLGLTGTSLGLALRREPTNFEIVGHDKQHDRSSLARKLGAVDRFEWNLFRACDQADMILIAVPYGELPELLTQLREDLKPGCLILALVSTLQPILAMGEATLPAEVHFLVGHPILSGVGAALEERADLFQDAIFCLVPSVHTDPEAVQVASNLISRIGAQPLFMDADEHDGMVSGVEQLPKLLAAALVRVNAQGASWRDAKKLAGRRFAQSTELTDSAAQLAGSLQANRDNLLRWLEMLREELNGWERLLRDGSPENLRQLLEGVVADREAWEREAFLKEWSDEAGSGAKGSEVAKEPGLLRQMFLGNMFGRRERR